MGRSPYEALLRTLEDRFAQHPERHSGIAWDAVRARLLQSPSACKSLAAMEATGGEPDIFGYDPATDQFTAYDSSIESPSGRRSVCYDQAARTSRKKNAPEQSAVELATAMGTTLLDESEYLALQRFGPFDPKTSSWILTPPEVRTLGGALFGDFRYGRTFISHNGADAYFAVRGFRTRLHF